ncbi:MAG: L-threonylcarbamoyladenylate synthase [Acidobacteriota bacterium]
MKTLRLIVDPGRLQAGAAAQALRQAAGILRAGGLVALPTETVYGLGANALDPAAVARIFAAKQRPGWDPIIVHIAPAATPDAMLRGLVEPAAVNDRVRRLMQAFWPGPLTLLLPRTSAVPDAITAGRPLVGLRMPAHPVAIELIRLAGLPIAAPSANLFGHISPTTAAHVLQDLDGRIDAVLDAGPTGYGVESTVLDPNPDPMIVYRPGAITAAQIRGLAGPVEVYRETGLPVETPRAPLPSPGVGLRHYAPRARLILVDAPLQRLSGEIAAAAAQFPPETVGVMLPAGLAAPPAIAPQRVYAWGRWDAPEELARRLYAGLRALDAQGCAVILCPLPPEEGFGAAIRDRLRKAAR